jgi:predicted alpha/beta-fold hydrolase
MDVIPYTPAARWAGGHRMTVYTWARPRRFPRLTRPEPRYFDVAPDARVLALCYWQPQKRGAGTLLALHGLEGSATAHYMQGLADKAFGAGMNVVLLNQRNCGGTEALSETLYHSGLTHDPRSVIEELVAVDGLGRIAVAGYSLGGNLTLKLAGEYGPDAPTALRAACAVSPTMDLAACVDALERPENRLYEWNFVRNLKSRLRRKARHFPERFDTSKLRAVRTVREFDDVYTAPHFGFGTAERYYREASSLRVADRIAVPTLILTSANDPFVPPAQFDAPALRGNPQVRVVVTQDGGHCGYVDDERCDDGYWAERMVVRFVKARCEDRAPTWSLAFDGRDSGERGPDPLTSPPPRETAGLA